ncbi:hypothetical protein [Brevibacillus laterosporus]|nr:hypothetical protein [Brevibacillus laterosporus]
MNILKVNGVDLAYDSFGNENDEAIILIAGLGTQMIDGRFRFVGY